MTSSGGDGWDNLLAGCFALAAIFIFALIFSSGRFTLDLASAFQIMFLRYAGGLLTVVVLAKWQGQTWSSMQSRHRQQQGMRALAGGLGGSALIFANMYMPLVDANAIGLLNVVFSLVLGFAVLGDRLRVRQLLGAAICLLGAATIMAARGAFAGFNTSYLLPSAVVVAGASLIAVEGIFIKILTRLDRPLVTLAHANFFGALLLLIPAVLTWQSTGWINLALLLLGPLAILGQYANIRAYSLAQVSVLAPLNYASLLFAALLGWVFFAELPSPVVVMGAALIVLGGTTIMLSRR
nr:DMT family transporter [uncultured Devosia sp.]